MKRIASGLGNTALFHARRQAFRAPGAVSRGYATAGNPSQSWRPLTYGAVGLVAGTLVTAGIPRSDDKEIKENAGVPRYADKPTMLKV